MTRTLVNGGCGFIGSHTFDNLIGTVRLSQTMRGDRACNLTFMFCGETV